MIVLDPTTHPARIAYDSAIGVACAAAVELEEAEARMQEARVRYDAARRVVRDRRFDFEQAGLGHREFYDSTPSMRPGTRWERRCGLQHAQDAEDETTD